MDLYIKAWRQFYFESISEFKSLKEAEDYQALGYIKFNQAMSYDFVKVEEDLWIRRKRLVDIETSDQLEMSKLIRNDTDIILVPLDSSDEHDNLLYDLYAYPPEGVGNEVKYWFNVKQRGTGVGGYFMKTKYIDLIGIKFKDPQKSRNSLHEINSQYDIWYRPNKNTQVQTGGKTRIRKNPHTKKPSKEVS